MERFALPVDWYALQTIIGPRVFRVHALKAVQKSSTLKTV